MSTLRLLYTTLPDHASALSLAEKCVTARLAACANIFPPITSVFHWEGTLQQTTEYALLLKTTQQQSRACMEYLLQHHPYDTPAILLLPVESAPTGFTDWVTKAANPLAES